MDSILYIEVNNDINITDFKQLSALLKHENIIYKSKKSKTLTKDE